MLDGVLARRGQPRAGARVASAWRAATVAATWLAAPRVLRPAQPIDDVLAAAYGAIARFVSTPHPIEAFEYVLRGIALAERSGDRAAHGTGLAMLSAYLAAASLGRFGDRALARARELAAASDSPYARMVTAGCAGILDMLRGNWAGMRATHEAGERECRRLGLERSWEASFLRSYWALGEFYAGDPARALAMLAELADHSDDLISRALLGSYRGRALVLAGDLAAARAVARELDATSAARRGLAGVYRRVLAGELALADHDWTRAHHLAGELARDARGEWLSALPAVSAMIDVLAATAKLGLAVAGDRNAAAAARRRARALHRRGSASFYAATALRLWGHAERLLDRPASAARVLDRAAAVAAGRGGALDRLAIAALRGVPAAAGALGAALAWNTGGEITG
jgi:hypothetical protein